MQIIPANAASPAPINFSLVDATDKETPEDINVSGVKPTVFIGTTALSGTAADIVKVNGATGQYAWTPTQAQVNVTAGLVLHGYIKPAGCAAREFFAQIGPSTALSAASTTTDIANAVNEGAIAAIKTAKRTGTNGNGGFEITGPTSGLNTGTLATNANTLPITEFDTAS